MGTEEGDPFRFQSDLSVQPRHAVIKSLAKLQNKSHLDLDTPLYEFVDPEALDALLLHRPEAELTITFSITDTTVTVWVDDEERVLVEVTDRAE